MSDINSNIIQSGAPGTLLRSAAEAQNQDPTKSQQPSAQPNSPIRSLTQNPIESTIPSTTPRVLNAVPVQQPSPDFTGLHAMLSSAPVPPPHVAASLIRAMMTPPSGGDGGVVAARPYVPAAPTNTNVAGNPGQSTNQPQTPQGPSNATPVVARPASAPVAPSSNGINRSGGFSPVNASLNRPSLSPQSFRSNASGALSQPQTRQNVVGNTPFIGGTIGTGLSSLFSQFVNFLKGGASTAEEELPNLEGLLGELPL